jgi:hypothetical protein
MKNERKTKHKKKKEDPEKKEREEEACINTFKIYMENESNVTTTNKRDPPFFVAFHFNFFF